MHNRTSPVLHTRLPARLWLTAAFAVGFSFSGQFAAAQVSSQEDSRLPTAPLREDVLSLPGDPARPVTLEVTLFTPVGRGPFPLAIMNHGATNASANNRGERYRFTISAYYFLSRGYAVALPMVRGFAGSGGKLVTAGCDVAALALANGRDIRAVIEALQARPDIDRDRVVVAGQSYGGWTTLGVGALPPPGIRGLVTFNTAIRSTDCPGNLQDSSMATAASRLGAKTVLPALMLYGENDSVMSTPAWRSLFSSYARANPRAELLNIGPFGRDSHQVLSDVASFPLWVPKLDAFLTRIGLPSAPIQSEYLPHPSPPATNYATLADIAAVPLSDQGKALYQKFLAGPQPRAFVIGPRGAVSQFNAGYDPLGFALRACGRLTPGCQPYAVNNSVVWTGLKPGVVDRATMRTITKAVRMNTSDTLGTFYSVNPDCTSRGLPKVVITNPPAHGTAAAAARDHKPAFSPGSAYLACNSTTVPAVAVIYTPVPGFTGEDAFTIDETDVDGKRMVLRIILTVS